VRGAVDLLTHAARLVIPKNRFVPQQYRVKTLFRLSSITTKLNTAKITHVMTVMYRLLLSMLRGLSVAMIGRSRAAH
jgi:hypothetical protein